MPRAPTKTLAALLFVNLLIATSLYISFLAGTPNWMENLETFIFCSAVGAVSVSLVNQFFKEDKMFGSKKRENGNFKERIQPGAENTAEEKVADQAQKPTLPGKTAAEVAKALTGIKILIDSMQVTDQETWSKVEDKSRMAADSLAKTEAALQAALDASREARAALEELASAVSERC